jgi:hypothetical protein
MMRRGRPGLIGTMARTAVIAGTAQATMNAVNSKAQQKAMAQQQAAEASAGEQPMAEMQQQAAPAAPAGDDIAAQLTQLKALTDQGILTQEEFEAKKRQILGI